MKTVACTLTLVALGALGDRAAAQEFSVNTHLECAISNYGDCGSADTVLPGLPLSARKTFNITGGAYSTTAKATAFAQSDFGSLQVQAGGSVFSTFGCPASGSQQSETVSVGSFFDTFNVTSGTLPVGTPSSVKVSVQIARQLKAQATPSDEFVYTQSGAYTVVGANAQPSGGVPIAREWCSVVGQGYGECSNVIGPKGTSKFSFSVPVTVGERMTLTVQATATQQSAVLGSTECPYSSSLSASASNSTPASPETVKTTVKAANSAVRLQAASGHDYTP